MNIDVYLYIYSYIHINIFITSGYHILLLYPQSLSPNLKKSCGSFGNGSKHVKTHFSIFQNKADLKIIHWNF